jgi:hypothetical protein
MTIGFHYSVYAKKRFDYGTYLALTRQYGISLRRVEHRYPYTVNESLKLNVSRFERSLVPSGTIL